MKKYKVGDTVEITNATGFKDSKVGDKAKVTNVWQGIDGCFAKLEKNGELLHLGSWQCFVVSSLMPNREFLADFIKLNKIKKTLVSKYLGMAENWLTTMVNEKRATRKDISDATLKDIMRKLHIDWTSQEFINVKATKSNTAYKTKPCNYSRVVDKERLQRSMWNGELVKA